MSNLLGHGHNRSLAVTGLVEIRLQDGLRRFSPIPNVSSARENVRNSETVAEARDTEIAENACSEGCKSNAVASAVDTQLHLVNSTREMFIG
jgi:hypothetical protein